MATDVIMPQMGESIAEGTIVKWLKKVGDQVKRDEPLFEISTDKVDAEIPSPSAGVLLEILATEGQTVPINTVVGRIGEAGEQPAASAPAARPEPTPQPTVQPVAAPVAQPTPVAEPASAPPAPPSSQADGSVAPQPPAAPAPAASGGSGSTDVIMPQMGESIAEGTIVKWLKKVGDQVKRDEPLFEISTDKVDAEIPSPSAGVLLEVIAGEGQTVPINTVVGRIGEAGAAAKPAATASAPAPSPAPTQATPTPAPQPAAPAPQPEPAYAAPAMAQASGSLSPEELRKIRSSPLVRKIARENSVDISRISGTGLDGRVTKHDILSYISNPQVAPTPAVSAPAQPATPVPTQPVAPPRPVDAPAPVAPPAQPVPYAPVAQPAIPVIPAYHPGERIEVVPMTPIRRKTAEHMIASRRTSAHVTSFFEIDLTNISKLREKHKETFLQRYGAKLTYMPFIMKATIDALQVWPIINASIDGNNIVYKKDINLGIAVALDWGLIVPVIKNAEEKNLAGLTRSLNDLADRARRKQLKPDEIQGGTFTITNPGGYGSLFGTPIINQPQVAIMGVGAIEKRLRVMADDTIAIRTMAYFNISFDHRLIDGAVADQFMAQVKKNLEGFTANEL